MIRYYDASALVKRYIRESGSRTVHNLLRAGGRAVSRLVLIEVASALARRAREGKMTPEGYDRAVARMNADVAGFDIVEITRALVEATQGILSSHPLRAADGLHLASALRLRAKTGADSVEFVCYDARLAAAARAEGLRVLPRIR